MDVTHDDYWRVRVDGVTVNGTSMDLGSVTEVQISSDDARVKFPRALYNTWKEYILTEAKRRGEECRITDGKFECTYSAAASLDQFVLTFEIGGHEFNTNGFTGVYCLFAPNEDVYCSFAVDPHDEDYISLGEPFIASFEIHFDLENGRLGVMKDNPRAKELEN
jgi:hypothetical protein